MRRQRRRKSPLRRPSLYEEPAVDSWYQGRNKHGPAWTPYTWQNLNHIIIAVSFAVLPFCRVLIFSIINSPMTPGQTMLTRFEDKPEKRLSDHRTLIIILMMHQDLLYGWTNNPAWYKQVHLTMSLKGIATRDPMTLGWLELVERWLQLIWALVQMQPTNPSKLLYFEGKWVETSKDSLQVKERQRIGPRVLSVRKPGPGS